MRADFLPYENYFLLFYRFWETLEMDIKLWIEYRNSFYSEVPIEKNTKEIQRMLSVYSTGRDCALNAAEDLNFEDISHYPTVDAFIKKCGFNIGC